MANKNKGIINYGTIHGDSSVEHKDQHIGDNISIEATGSNVNVNSVLENTTQSIAGLDSFNSSQRSELEDLISVLPLKTTSSDLLRRRGNILMIIA